MLATLPLIPILGLAAVIVVVLGIVYLISQVYNKVPEWRLHPKARRQVKDAKEAVKIWKIQKKYPLAAIPVPIFTPLAPVSPNLNPVEQEVIDDIVKDVVDKEKLL